MAVNYDHTREVVTEWARNLWVANSCAGGVVRERAENSFTLNAFDSRKRPGGVKGFVSSAFSMASAAMARAPSFLKRKESLVARFTDAVFVCAWRRSAQATNLQPVFHSLQFALSRRLESAGIDAVKAEYPAHLSARQAIDGLKNMTGLQADVYPKDKIISLLEEIAASQSLDKDGRVVIPALTERIPA